MSIAPTIVSLVLLALGFSLTVEGKGQESLGLLQGKMLSLIQENIMNNIIKELKDVMKVMENADARNELLQMLDSMDLKVTKDGKDEKCIRFSLSSDTCSMDFKIARMSEVLPKLASQVSTVKDCSSLLQAAHPVVSNSCVCDKVHVSEGCPDVIHKIAKATKIFC